MTAPMRPKTRAEEVQHIVEAMAAELSAWLGACLEERPASPLHLELLKLGVPACHTWALPAGPMPTHQELSPLKLIGEWQNDQCGLCGSPGRETVLDHCHRTGLIRGLLCRSCNVHEGLRHDSPAVIAYRLRSPAVLLGVTEPYYSPWKGYASPHRGVVVPDDPAAAARALHREAVASLLTAQEETVIETHLSPWEKAMISRAVTRWTTGGTTSA